MNLHFTAPPHRHQEQHDDDTTTEVVIRTSERQTDYFSTGGICHWIATKHQSTSTPQPHNNSSTHPRSPTPYQFTGRIEFHSTLPAPRLGAPGLKAGNYDKHIPCIRTSQFPALAYDLD